MEASIIDDTVSTKKASKPRKAPKPKNYSGASKLPIPTSTDTASTVTPSPALQTDEKLVAVNDIISIDDVESGPVTMVIYGEPTPLSRHMVSRGHMYNPSAGLQKEFATACVDFLPALPLTGPLEATLFFYFSRPKNHYGTGKNANVLKPLTAGNWHCKRKGDELYPTHIYFYCLLRMRHKIMITRRFIN